MGEKNPPLSGSCDVHPFCILLLEFINKFSKFFIYAGGKQFSLLHVQDDVAASSPDHMDHHTKDLLLPFQCFCSRRGVCIHFPTSTLSRRDYVRFGGI